MTWTQIIGGVWSAIHFWEMAVVAVFALFCYVLRQLDRSGQAPTFKFHDFFTSGDWPGKASGPRLAYFGAFLTHSLVVLHHEMKSKDGLDYAMASLYALIWSGAYVALKAIDMKAAQTAMPASTSTTTTSTTTTGDSNGNVPRT